jgi:hypothetical protein
MTNVSELAEKSIPLQPKRGAPSIAIADNEVKQRGDNLGDIWWRGAQWAITPRGLESLDGTYLIDGNSTIEDPPEYTCVKQMAGKAGVDIDEFTTAWMIALILHGFGPKMKPEELRELFAQLPARRQPLDRSADQS